MKPTTMKERLGLDEEAIFEDSNSGTTMTDEELKIESLKIATNIGKLMSNVTTEDIVSIAETVAKFIKGGDDVELETTTSDDSESSDETAEDFTTDEEPEATDTEATEDTGDESNESLEEPEEDFEI